MDHLLQSKAPISEAAWAEINSEATRSLKHFLAARKVISYNADGDWERSAVSVGRVEEPVETDGTRIQNRAPQALTEIRVPFTLDRRTLESIDRGAQDADLDPVVDAARRAGKTEDRAIFVGRPDAGIIGISEDTPYDVLKVDAEMRDLTHVVAKAMNRIQDEGVQGPYAMAAGPTFWERIMEANELGGYPLVKHLNLLLDVPVVWAPGMERAVVLSLRGGDFEIIGGQDWSIGYLDHDADKVELYLEESFTFLLNTPEAAIVLDIDE